eukprot:11315907-Alexandrium_andersonii.AAC.1
MSGVAYHLCPRWVAVNIMGHSELDGDLGARPKGLLREAVVEGNLVGEEGGLRAHYVQLMP